MPLPMTTCISRVETEEEKEARRKKKEARRISKAIEKALSEAHKNELSCLKLLLLGTGESGKTTILKQMKIIHINVYTDSEKLEYIPHIKRNLRDAMIALVAGMDLLHIPFQHRENEAISATLMKESLEEGYTYPDSFYDMVTTLWKDDGVQEAFQRSNEFQLIDSAKYFLEKISIIRQPDFIPSIQDILRCRQMTDGINEVNFEVKDGRRTKVSFKVFDVGGQRGERKKWIQLFDSVTAILFLADVSSFDMTLREDRSKNRLVDALEVFHQAWMNKYLQSVPILVFINKIDILEEKVRAGRTMNPLLDLVFNWSHRNDLAYLYNNNDKSRHPYLSECPEDDTPSYHNSSSSDNFNHSPFRHIVASADQTDCGIVRHVTPPAQSQIEQQHFAQQVRVNGSSGYLGRRFSMAQMTAIRRKSSRQEYGTASVMQIFADKPYSKFQPTAEEKKEFLNSYPLDEDSRLQSPSTKKTKHREVPVVNPETIRIACYVKHILAELSKFKVVTDDGMPRRRKCLFYYTCAVNTDNIQKVLDGCRAFLMEEHLERFGIL